MKTNFLFYFFIVCCCIQSYGQEPVPMDDLEQNLCQTLEDDIEVAIDGGDFRSTKVASFGQNLDAVLHLKESWKHPFNKLKRKIRIIESIDKQLRIFSWDTHRGGTWHDMQSYLQYKENGRINVQQLHLEEESYTDVIYYQVDNFEHKNGRIYLLSGFGTHGAGHHHKIMRAFQRQGDHLVELNQVFNGQDYLVIIAARKDRINLNFERDGLKITFDEFTNSENSPMGFAKATGKEITYAWNGKRFIHLK